MSGVEAHDRHPYTYPEWQMHTCSNFWLWAFLCDVTIGPANTWLCWARGCQRPLTGLLNQKEVWIRRMKIIGTFLGPSLLVHKHRIPGQSPPWRRLIGNAHESNAYNPANSAPILWCTHPPLLSAAGWIWPPHCGHLLTSFLYFPRSLTAQSPYYHLSPELPFHTLGSPPIQGQYRINGKFQWCHRKTRKWSDES